MSTDRQLLIRAAAGDESGFTALYARYAPRLTGYFRVRTEGNDALAADLSQQVFLRLLKSRVFRDAERGPADLAPLLFTIAANLLRNHYRDEDRRRQRTEGYRQLQSPAHHASDPPVDPADLEAALKQLPEEQRRCLHLRFRQQLSVAEIAESVGCAPGTVKSRLHYGLKKMAALLQPVINDR